MAETIARGFIVRHFDRLSAGKLISRPRVKNDRDFPTSAQKQSKDEKFGAEDEFKNSRRKKSSLSAAAGQIPLPPLSSLGILQSRKNQGGVTAE
ncbi:hypothetical protein [Algoriphagus litoralis]|uniref:hypothetical protein n=1 Tax=Algoriphagus litoralis TaxID=2202829 RepID=UPI000DB9428A|nr:hypothetical protein [Algoriphagus litoralis]